ncbi:MAG: SRPBCC family protein, partial [Planctomycetota bacterium]
RCRDHAGMGRDREPGWDLPELAGPDRVRHLGPVTFVRLPGGASPGPDFGAVETRVGHLLREPHHEDVEGRAVYDIDANWALYVENYLEGFHVRWVHPSLSRQLDAEAYRYDLFAGGSVQVGASSTGEGAFALDAGHPDADLAVTAWYFHLFPNTFLNVYRWGLSVNVVEPRGPDRARVRYRRFVRDVAALGEGPGSNLHDVELEDDAIVASVAQGLRSRLARPGRYSLVHERAVHHFHRMYLEALGSA